MTKNPTEPVTKAKTYRRTITEDLELHVVRLLRLIEEQLTTDFEDRTPAIMQDLALSDLRLETAQQEEVIAEAKTQEAALRRKTAQHRKPDADTKQHEVDLSFRTAQHEYFGAATKKLKWEEQQWEEQQRERDVVQKNLLHKEAGTKTRTLCWEEECGELEIKLKKALYEKAIAEKRMLELKLISSRDFEAERNMDAKDYMGILILILLFIYWVENRS